MYVNGEKITSVKDSGKDHGDRSVDVFLPADWKQAADGYVKDFVISSPGSFMNHLQVFISSKLLMAIS